MDITIFSDDLYEYLLRYEELENLHDELRRDRTVNGLSLLKHYHYLENEIESVRIITYSASTTSSILLEMDLLVNGLLIDGEVLKSYGYEDLYEHGYLDFNLWKKFQQDSFEKDVLALDASYHEVDDEFEDDFDEFGDSADFSATSEEQDSDKSPGMGVDLEPFPIWSGGDFTDDGFCTKFVRYRCNFHLGRCNGISNSAFHH